MKSDNVSVGKPKITGAIFRAPVGTALPTDATTELNEAFKEQGYVTEDGVTNSYELESETVKAWGGDIVETPETGVTDSWNFSLMESLNTETMKTVYGDENVTGTLESGIKVAVKSSGRDASAWVIDTILKGGYLRRLVIPNGKITEMGEIVYQDAEAIAYPITITGSADEDGATHYEYTNKPTA